MHRVHMLGCVMAMGLCSSARADESPEVADAIGRGVKYLKSCQHENGAWQCTQALGATALAALTLVECGVPTDDRSVRRAAEFVRRECAKSTHTYSISLAVILLDRLGDPSDAPLVESLGIRLLAGQNAEGGWSYKCPVLSSEETQRLRSMLPADRRRLRGASREHSEFLAALLRSAPRAAEYGDNSNTQFANLGLWVAGRHGLPVDSALAAIAARYRRGQQPDGGWLYDAADPSLSSSTLEITTRGSMTCAALLGLAIADAATSDAERAKRNLSRDRNLRAGLLALGTLVGTPVASGNAAAIPRIGGRMYYFFWSLERLCVALDFNTLSRKNWYAWGTQILLANQERDGSWRGEFAEFFADTCFALLFLKRANLAGDLTQRMLHRVHDPGGSTLRSQGMRAGGDLGTSAPPRDEPFRPAQAPAPARKTMRGDPVVTRLADELVNAPQGKQADVLQRLQEAHGVKNTEALVVAIGQLEGESKQKARDVLARRLARMQEQSIDRYLRDSEPEIRRAAAQACAMRGLASRIPRLIPLLGDSNPAVAQAAHQALKELSGQNLGPDASTWQAWWVQRGK